MNNSSTIGRRCSLNLETEGYEGMGKLLRLMMKCGSRWTIGLLVRVSGNIASPQMIIQKPHIKLL